MATTFGEDFRRFFLRGLAAVLPTALTIAIIVWLFRLIHDHVGQPINVAVAYLSAWVQTWTAEPESFGSALQINFLAMRSWWDDWFWWVGFVVALVGVYLFGRFVASFVGRFFWRMIEGGFFRMPVIKAVYPSVKQVTDFLLSERQMEVSRVAAVEYPRKGIWSLGLVTSSGLKTLQHGLNTDLVTVFIPSSPTPVTGYTITVRRDEIIDLPLTIDEALRFTISGGVIMPLGQGTDGPLISRRIRQHLAESEETKE